MPDRSNAWAATGSSDIFRVSYKNGSFVFGNGLPVGDSEEILCLWPGCYRWMVMVTSRAADQTWTFGDPTGLVRAGTGATEPPLDFCVASTFPPEGTSGPVPDGEQCFDFMATNETGRRSLSIRITDVNSGEDYRRTCEDDHCWQSTCLRSSCYSLQVVAGENETFSGSWQFGNSFMSLQGVVPSLSHTFCVTRGHSWTSPAPIMPPTIAPTLPPTQTQSRPDPGVPVSPGPLVVLGEDTDKAPEKLPEKLPEALLSSSPQQSFAQNLSQTVSDRKWPFLPWWTTGSTPSDTPMPTPLPTPFPTPLAKTALDAETPMPTALPTPLPTPFPTPLASTALQDAENSLVHHTNVSDKYEDVLGALDNLTAYPVHSASKPATVVTGAK